MILHLESLPLILRHLPFPSCLGYLSYQVIHRGFGYLHFGLHQILSYHELWQGFLHRHLCLNQQMTILNVGLQFFVDPLSID